jgi:UDPglucose 6-dehydrogenase
VKTAQDAGSPMRLIETTVDINDRRKLGMADKVIAAMGGSVAGKKIAVLGLAFKPNTDDMRDAPSLAIIPALQAAGAEIMAHDPVSMDEARKVLNVGYAATPYEAADGADGVVLITEWDVYRALDMKRLKAAMRGDVMADLRNVYRPEQMRGLGFRYVSIGRG